MVTYKNKSVKINKNVKINKSKKKKKVNMSLYADYHPHTSVKGFGYKNEEVALATINKLEKMDKNGELVKKLCLKEKSESECSKKIRSYKLQVINTMYNRAKYHKYRSNDMVKAMKIFKKYLDKIKK